ncbi:MAG: Inosine/uridine-preferring nucleoside hydrolase [Microbacteriaceae bacterium]|jgi:purine nucleosidase|nr:Inosine/uridine-preferring nucleoside hydrolase [Microbacteriaceae bacterium]
MMRLPFYLDCDTGIDDAMALAYLLASERVDLLGVGSVSGNISAAVGAANTLDLLALAGRDDIPVAVGAHDFLAHEFHGGATHVHGENGIGGVVLPHAQREMEKESAAEMIVRLAHAHPGELRIIAIGPLTNLALALRLDADLAALVHDVTIMGGAALVPGNVTRVAEANIHNDPEAAAEVLAADWFVTMVPLDATMESTIEADDRDVLEASNHPVARAIGAMLDTYFDFYVRFFGRRTSALHDPLAAAIAVGDLELGEAPVVHVEVDTTEGPGRGQTICELRYRFLGHPEQEGAHCRVVLSVVEPFTPKLMAAMLRL